MPKFENANPVDDGVLKSDDFKPCFECGEDTNYIDICTESRCCSTECMEKSMSEMYTGPLPEEDVPEDIVPVHIMKRNYLEELEEIKNCPMCRKPVKYGNMIWLNGMCTCPHCYEHRRMEMK
jgi:hypothetical protein